MNATLYRFFNEEGTLLYVGVTTMGLARWSEHARYKDWWPLVASTTTDHFTDQGEALAAELAAIRSEHPTYNIAGADRPQRRTTRTRANGRGSIFYHSDRDRWVVLTPGERKAYYFVAERQARAFLDAFLVALEDRTVRRALVKALGLLDTVAA